MNRPVNVVLFLYRKTESVPSILQQLNLYKPEKLYLVLDRSDRETESNIKSLIQSHSRGSELHWIIPEEHKGLGRIFDFGLNAVFQREDSIIILEDDTLPTPGFFAFCNQQLYEKKDQSEISSIIGTPLSPGLNSDPFTSRFGFPYWGWATWKDRWISMPANDDFFQDLDDSNEKLQSILNTFTPTRGLNISWDVRWSIWQYIQKRIVLVSGINFISNTGFTELGTFTKNSQSAFSQISTIDLDSVERTPNPEEAYWDLIWKFLSEYRQA